jgi:hypothetical protein
MSTRRSGVAKIAELANNPGRLVQFVLRKANWGTFPQKVELDLLPRPHYAYGLYRAALQARSLKMPRISAIELGVAGGNGLVALEQIAGEVERETGVGVDVYGFDLGGGMPEASDYRDLPYVWQKGFFAMDVPALQRRLKKAQLKIGDVGQTIGEFVAAGEGSPVGFISFDLDYYSSTVKAFGLLRADVSRLMPRVFCYFDDCLGDDWELHSAFTGELLAIDEFNNASSSRKLARINGLRHKRAIQAAWNDALYVLHVFDHPQYTEHVLPTADWQMPLSAGR